MSIEIRDYVAVSAKLIQLGIKPPTGFAILPSNLDDAQSTDELCQHAESETVKKLFRVNNIAYSEIFDADKQPAYLQQYGFEWFGPTLFITTAALSQDPTLLNVSLNIISSYLYDFFKGAKDGTASLEVIVEKPDGSCKKVKYKGPVEGLTSIPDILHEMGGDR